jgi:1-phosphatidylinositol phosphodiesterase
MSPNLTIRNLSSTPLELRSIEKYAAVSEAPGAAQIFTNLAANITSAVGIRGPQSNELIATVPENTEPFAKEETSIRVEPFRAVTTDKAGPEPPSEAQRLTFDINGQQYRVDIPSPTGHSNELIPVGADGGLKISAVFVPGDNFLALFSTANLQAWMAELQDHVPISALSIPGTHNSPTCFTALPSVRCQVATPKQQLEAGVRFFDIRVQPESPEDLSKDGLILVHGVFPISLTGAKYLRPVIADIEDFLAQNPRETVIVSIKREGPGEHTDQQLAQIVRNHYATDTSKWWVEPRIPRLGEVRGKIVLMRRFVLDDEAKQLNGGQGWAINAENWAYNCEHDVHGEFVVQDFCEVLETQNIDKKIEVTCAQLSRSGCSQADMNPNAPIPPIHLNFLSASNFWNVGCWPNKIAAKLNPAVLSHLCVKHLIEHQDADWCTGIVVCDWVGDRGDWDLVKAIVGMNAKLIVRQ